MSLPAASQRELVTGVFSLDMVFEVTYSPSRPGAKCPDPVTVPVRFEVEATSGDPGDQWRGNHWNYTAFPNGEGCKCPLPPSLELLPQTYSIGTVCYPGDDYRMALKEEQWKFRISPRAC
jgi:hypothetical protein